MAIALVLGTRPELIKLVELYFLLKKRKIKVFLVSTNQQPELLNNLLKEFKIKPEIEIKALKKGRSLSQLTSYLVKELEKVFLKIKPKLVVVQGDTATGFSAAISAFYLGLKIAHIEAGLRTFNLQEPFPEEMNRRFISMVSNLHFAPVKDNQKNLLKEGVNKKKVFVTGNTVCDAAFSVLKSLDSADLERDIFSFFKNQEKLKNKVVLFTMHRREASFQYIKKVCSWIKLCFEKFKNLKIVYIKHPNPKFSLINDFFSEKFFENKVKIINPISYKNLIFTLSKVKFVITDSGGILEEAVCLKKPVICIRSKSERFFKQVESLVSLVGENKKSFLNIFKKNFDDISLPVNLKKSVFGDGLASQRIIKHLEDLSFL